jgi:hypothetical protein
MPSPQKRLVSGVFAGALATIPMTAFMVGFFRRLPWHQRYAPPPHQVAMEVAEVARLKKHLDLDARLALTTASHFGYGATMGALFSTTEDHFAGPPAVRGAAFGLTVWGASYLGWLSAAGFRARAGEQSFERNCMMVAAHLVFGASLGVLYDRFTRSRPRRQRPSPPVADNSDPARSPADLNQVS